MMIKNALQRMREAAESGEFDKLSQEYPGDFEAFRKAYFDGMPQSWSREERVAAVNRPEVRAIFDRMRRKYSEEIIIPNYRCLDCQDRGWVKLDKPLFDETGRVNKATILPCPNPKCPVSAENNRKRFENWTQKMEHIPSGGYYREMTLKSFDELLNTLPDDLRAGKDLAFVTAVMYAESGAGFINNRAIYQAIGATPPDRLISRNSLYFYGGLGVGKTGLACGIAAHLTAKNIAVLMTRTSDLLVYLISLKTSKERLDATFTDTMSLLRAFPLLILDEFELQTPTTAQKQIMEDLIRGRHADRRPTIFTTNLTPDDLYHHWGGKTADVVLGMSHIIPVTGVKLREAGDTIE